jgi:hypothetical protein
MMPPDFANGGFDRVSRRSRAQKRNTDIRLIGVWPLAGGVRVYAEGAELGGETVGALAF